MAKNSLIAYVIWQFTQWGCHGDDRGFCCCFCFLWPQFSKTRLQASGLHPQAQETQGSRSPCMSVSCKLFEARGGEFNFVFSTALSNILSEEVVHAIHPSVFWESNWPPLFWFTLRWACGAWNRPLGDHFPRNSRESGHRTAFCLVSREDWGTSWWGESLPYLWAWDKHWHCIVAQEPEGLPRRLSVKNPPANAERRVHPWVGTIPWRRKWQPTPVFLPGKCHGCRSLVGYSSWGCKETRLSNRARPLGIGLLLEQTTPERLGYYRARLLIMSLRLKVAYLNWARQNSSLDLSPESILVTWNSSAP